MLAHQQYTLETSSAHTNIGVAHPNITNLSISGFPSPVVLVDLVKVCVCVGVCMLCVCWCVLFYACLFVGVRVFGSVCLFIWCVLCVVCVCVCSCVANVL